jgi:hypothetical protein
MNKRILIVLLHPQTQFVGATRHILPFSTASTSRHQTSFIKSLLTVVAVIAAAAFYSVPAFTDVVHSDRDCLSCHSAEINSTVLHRKIHRVDDEAFAQTPHKKIKCVDCHSTAVLLAKPKTHMKPKAIQPVNCGQCHFKGNKIGAPQRDIANEYARGVHGREMKIHNPDVPGCKDCHGYHDIFPAKDPRSMVNRLRQVDTCGSCHRKAALMKKYKFNPDLLANYRQSVHGQGVIKLGLNVTAVCSDCHGSHDIRPPDDRKSLINRWNIPLLCGRCHEGIFEIYRKSIHGAQWAKGNKDVPVCTSCHGEHIIAAPENKFATVNPSNVGNTCSHCHSSKPITDKYNLPSDRLASFKSSYHGTALQLNNLVAANCASCHGSHDILPSSDPRSSINPNNLARTCSQCHSEAFKNRKIGKVHVSPSPRTAKLLYYVKLVYILLISGSVGGFLFYISLDLFGAWRRRRATRRK